MTRTLLPFQLRTTSPLAFNAGRTVRLLLLATLPLLLLAPVSAAEPSRLPAGPTLGLKSAGALVIVGGGKMPDVVRDRFLQLAGGKNARLVVIPTASASASRPDVSTSYLFWRSQNVSSVEFLHTRDRQLADDPRFAEPLTHATGVWLTGGDQSRLTDAYQNTNVLKELRKVLERGGVIGGTSAGASVMSTMMITGGSKTATLGTGFGLVPGMVVDQHFANRNRMGRLLGVLAEHPEMLGVGIDEQTAAVVRGETLSVIGNANVWLCQSPTTTLPVSVQRLKTGDQLDLLSLTQTLFARNKGSADKSARSTTTVPPSESPGPTKGP